MHSIVYTIVYYLWCRTEERGAWDACSYTDYLCILQCRRYVCRVRVILVLILKSVFFIYKTAFKLLRCLVYIKAKNYVVHQSSFSHLHHARWTFFLALVWYLHGHVICLWRVIPRSSHMHSWEGSDKWDYIPGQWGHPPTHAVWVWLAHYLLHLACCDTWPAVGGK